MNYSTDSIARNEDQSLPYSGERRRDGDAERKKSPPDFKDDVRISQAARQALLEDAAEAVKTQESAEPEDAEALPQSP